VYFVDVFFFFDQTKPEPNGLNYLMAARSDTLLQPWTWWRFLTSGFAHDPENAFHLIGNMLGLFFLGQSIEELYGRRLFLRMYLTSIVLCSFVWCLTEAIAGYQNHYLVGASGAVTTVVMLFALNYPRRTILFMMFIPMPAWILGVMIVVFNLLGARDPNSRVAYDVHLVGAAYGFLFFKTRFELGALLAPASLAGKFRWPKRRPKLKVHDPDERYSNLDAKADEVLEKLHRDGEASLTPRERRVLEDYSRRMQQKHR
jgi:membrane associated rhomboid family serine protease